MNKVHQQAVWLKYSFLVLQYDKEYAVKRLATAYGVTAKTINKIIESHTTKGVTPC
jgi:plasmid maintenance system antidote protein VapI